MGVANQGGYDNTAVNARVGHKFANKSEIEAFFIRSEGLNQFPGFDTTAPTGKQFVNQVVGTSFSMDVMDRWRSSVTFGQSQDQSKNIGSLDLANNSVFNTTRWNASWTNQLILNDKNTATLGADYRVDQVDGNTIFTKTSRYDVGFFGELHSKIFDSHFVTASLRWDQNQAFGDYVTGNIGWRFNWNYGLSAFASFGNAFKAPTFNDLYYPIDSWGYYGNPNLKPEESTSIETGFAGNHNWGNWQLRAYHTDISNLISWSYNLTPTNVDKAQIDGIEAEIDTQFFGWTHKVTGNLLSPIDRINNSRLLRRADKTLSYDIYRSFGAIDLGVKVLAQSDRPDSDVNYNPTTVNGFVTLDFRTAYHIDKNWMISGKLNNILDKHYQTVSNYNMADRNFFLSIHYNN
jgi:vitamin B12 transporter